MKTETRFLPVRSPPKLPVVCPHVPAAPICHPSWALLSSIKPLLQTVCLAGGTLTSLLLNLNVTFYEDFPHSLFHRVMLYADASTIIELSCIKITCFCHPTTFMPQCLLNKQKNFRPWAKVPRKWDKEIAWYTTWSKNLFSGFDLIVVSSVLGHILTLISISPFDNCSSCFFSY